jgi:mRNA interferase MazF
MQYSLNTNSNPIAWNANSGKVATLSSTNPPRRGEIWLVNFDPTIGAEIKKPRPAVVISSDAVGRLPIKLVTPITDWKDPFARNIWHVRIDPDQANGLSKPSTADALQIRSLDLQRFIRKLGAVSPAILDEIGLAICSIIEYP